MGGGGGVDQGIGRGVCSLVISLLDILLLAKHILSI